MTTEKCVVVKIGAEPYLTSYSCGETIDGLLGRVHQTLGVSTESSRLFLVDHQIEANYLPKQMDIEINFLEDFNSSSPWMSSLFVEVDSMILHLRPTIKSLMARKVVLEYIKKNLSKCLGARVFCIGSSMNNIFLPNETIEVTPFLCKGQEDKWFLRVNEGLCSAAMASGGDDGDVHIRSITFNCESASILVDINQLTVNVCHNELVSLYSGALLEDLNHNFGRNSIIKKSLLLIKSWCCYDSSQYSAVGKSLFPDLLSAKVLHILVLHLFCRYGAHISHPLMALSMFLYYYSNIDWKSVIFSIESAISTCSMKSLSDDEFLTTPAPFRDFDISCSDESQQVKTLITNYRLRYQSTIWASTRAKEEDMTEIPSDPITRDSSVTERESDDRLFDNNLFSNNISKGQVAWGIASACPSLTNEFQPPVGLPLSSEWEPERKKLGSEQTFHVSHMNVSDSIRPFVNLTENISAQDVSHISSILSCGRKRFARVLHRCKQVAQTESDTIDVGMGVHLDLVKYFISESMGMSRDVANIHKLSSFSPDDAANIDELKSSKYFCESEGPESVMRHAELIMGSKITSDAVAHLIAHIVEQAGPHPIGEIGKLLQEATGNPNLSRVLKSQFRGLKKLIEGYPHMLRLGGDHSFNPHVYLADKSSCSINSESCIETLMETMTDRDSDDLLSPSGSLSQPSKKNIAQSAPGTLSNGRSVTPESQHLGIFSNSGSGYPQYSYYRPDTVSSKQRTSISASTAWQLQDRNQYVPSNQKGFSGSNRLHPEAGEFEPGRGLVDYGTSIVGHKSRTDYRALDMNRNQPLSSNVMPQSYAYRSKQVDQHQGYSGPRSQNIPIFSNSLRVSPQSNRSAGQMPVRYDECESNRLTQSNRLSFGNTLFAAGRDSWDRSSLTQMDPDSSLSQISHSGSARFTQGNPRSFAYDDYSRSRPNSFSTGRISHGDNSEIGLDSESERQSFLFPNDYDPGNQSFSLSDYDLLRDAVYANTTQSIPLHTFGHEEDSNSSTRNLRYEDIDYTHESYRDSRMLAYFLKDSM